MTFAPFLLERLFARHEFSARRMLSSSDCESLSMREVLGWADEEMAERWRELRLSYTDPRGLPILRREIAGLYQRVSEDELLTAVPEEGIFLAMHALLGAGDRVVVTWPGYQSLHSIAEGLGCEVVRWTAREEGGWRFDVDELRALARGADGIIVNFPHNPTGAMPSAEELAAIVDIARREGAWLFSDEMYRFLEHPPATTLPSAVDLYERAVVLGGLSKAFALPGLRMGWLAAQDLAFLDRVAALKDYTTICAGAPDEVLSVIALRAREPILARNRALVVENIGHAEAFAARTGLLSFARPRGGSITLARLRGGGATAFCERLVAETGLFLVASAFFEFGDDHVRLGLGRADFPAALDELGAWIS
jgi:aspartate/methionine/tyrosine aminotransferase